MPLNHRTSRIASAAVALSMAGLGGCIEYQVDTTLRPDGTGRRELRVEATNAHDLQDYDLTTQDFQRLTFLSEEEGWSYSAEVHEDGGTTHIFQRDRGVETLDAWSALEGDIRIAAALPSASSSKLGYLTLGDVHFRNRILVGTSQRSDGSETFNYQETFFWENGVDAILEVVLQEVEAALRRSYPRVPERDRGEILGFARASLWDAVEEGVFDVSGEWEDRLWAEAIRRTARQAIKVIRTSYPEAQEDSLREATDVFSGDSEEALIDALVHTLPGLNLAINSEVSFRLTMPGQVTNTNAHEQDGNTLIWEFGPADALGAPILLVAESVMGS